LEQEAITTTYPTGRFIAEVKFSRRVRRPRGRVKLSICGSDGRTLILRIVEVGCPLGVAAAFPDAPMSYARLRTLRDHFLRQSDVLASCDSTASLPSGNPAHQPGLRLHLPRNRDLILSDSASKNSRLLVGWLDQNTEARNPAK